MEEMRENLVSQKKLQENSPERVARLRLDDFVGEVQIATQQFQYFELKARPLDLCVANAVSRQPLDYERRLVNRCHDESVACKALRKLRRKQMNVRPRQFPLDPGSQD